MAYTYDNISALVMAVESEIADRERRLAAGQDCEEIAAILRSSLIGLRSELQAYRQSRDAIARAWCMLSDAMDGEGEAVPGPDDPGGAMRPNGSGGSGGSGGADISQPPAPGQPQPITAAQAAAHTPRSRRFDRKPETEADRRFFDLREAGYLGPLNQDSYPCVDGNPHIVLATGWDLAGRVEDSWDWQQFTTRQHAAAAALASAQAGTQASAQASASARGASAPQLGDALLIDGRRAVITDVISPLGGGDPTGLNIQFADGQRAFVNVRAITASGRPPVLVPDGRRVWALDTTTPIDTGAATAPGTAPATPSAAAGTTSTTSTTDPNTATEETSQMSTMTKQTKTVQVPKRLATDLVTIDDLERERAIAVQMVEELQELGRQLRLWSEGLGDRIAGARWGSQPITKAVEGIRDSSRSARSLDEQLVVLRKAIQRTKKEMEGAAGIKATGDVQALTGE